MYKAIQNLRNSPAHQLQIGKPVTHIYTTPPTYMQPGQGTPLQLKTSRNYYNAHYRKTDYIGQGFLTLLRHLQFAPATTTQPGVTWLELLILAHAMNATNNTTTMPLTATNAPSIGAMLTKFTNQAKTLVQLVLTEADQSLFKASRTTHNRLGNVGHTNRLQHTMCQVALAPEI
eukprot:10982415-Karenia_brevis.AAC.1